MNYDNNTITATFLGLAIADALGVPVEFKDRETLKLNPVTDMRAFGSHYQPKGTWSDDSSLTFCLAESLCNGYSINDIARKGAQWYTESLWTPHGVVFDIGNTTRKAIDTYLRGTPASLCGGKSEYDNGNGSLMRISPIAFYSKNLSIEKRYDIVKEVSEITHAHIRSVISCFIYVEYIIESLNTGSLTEAYKNMQNNVSNFLRLFPICSQNEISVFDRVLNGNIQHLKENEIQSGGYVVHTLEASLWCLLNSSNYTEAVLKAVNLGNDTDTTATVVGAIAGMYYGTESIPKEWVESLVRKEDIIFLSQQFAKKYHHEN